MRRLSYILLAVSSAWAMTACTEEKVEKFEFKEFGISQSEIQFPAKIEYSDGKVVSDLKKEIRVLSNQECVISYVDGIENLHGLRHCVADICVALVPVKSTKL